ncbi:hypothetical protein O7R08_15500 [Vibrio alginolyticus]|uniref:hypothetical protein n=1 Tax=Vibrio alginolyticus TaxID=663 RepID=UPI0022DD2F5F|nr:hypothetical protein [Vibrio alginolyticus]MDA0407346.1 hypothetical protein [Vibrio alginolyticus]
MFGKNDGWNNIFSDDPLGYKRDAAIKAKKDKSLSSMDLFSDLSFGEKMELDRLINDDGSLDQMGLAFSSFKQKSQSESEFDKSMKWLAVSSPTVDPQEESYIHNAHTDEWVDGYGIGSDINNGLTEEELAFYQDEDELNDNEPAIQAPNLSLSEKLDNLKALDHHRVLVFCPNLIEGGYSPESLTCAEFLVRFKLE